jgi:hypothetical protein
MPSQLAMASQLAMPSQLAMASQLALFISAVGSFAQLRVTFGPKWRVIWGTVSRWEMEHEGTTLVGPVVPSIGRLRWPPEQPASMGGISHSVGRDRRHIPRFTPAARDKWTTQATNGGELARSRNPHGCCQRVDGLPLSIVSREYRAVTETRTPFKPHA